MRAFLANLNHAAHGTQCTAIGGMELELLPVADKARTILARMDAD